MPTTRWIALVGITISAVFFQTTANPVYAQVATDIFCYHGMTLNSPQDPITSNGVNATEPQLVPGNVTAAGFGKQFAVDITDKADITGIPSSELPLGSAAYLAANGKVYAQPLVETSVNITTGSAAGTHNFVFVATSMDSLYAFDADNGALLWKDSFIYNVNGNHTNPNPLNATIPSGVTPVPGGTSSEINSADIQPWVGIVGTPVIDGSFLYLVAKTREIPGGSSGDQTHPHYVYTLHKVRIADGFDTNTIIADTTLQTSDTTYTYNTTSIAGNAINTPYVLGTGDGATTLNTQSVVYFNAVRQLIRPALGLYNGNIYIASGSHSNNGPYHGWVLSYTSSTLACNGAWNATPNGSGGGIWQSGGGVVVDSSGNIYFATGNGTFDGDNNSGAGPVTGLDTNGFPVNGNYGNCFVKLAVDTNTTEGNQGTNLNGFGLKVVDYFCPSNQSALNTNGQDLGSGGPTLLPDSAGSVTHPHLLVGGGEQGTLYLIDRDNMGKFDVTNDVVQSLPGALNGLYSIPAYFNGKLYVTPGAPASSASLSSWSLANGIINTGSQQNSSDTYGYAGSSPFISANGTSNGIVWAIDNASSELRAYDASNLSELWTSDQNSSRDALGATVKFAVPVPANGRVYVATGSSLVVYGPVVAPSAAPGALNVIATSTTSSYVSWTDNSNNESGFLIERSPDNTTFTQIGTTGPNVTYFSDTGLAAQTTYYYRVRAYNTIITSAYSAYSNTANLTTPASGGQAPLDLYHFDEGGTDNTTTLTLDSGLNANNGTLIGLSPAQFWTLPGRIGPACLTFTGTGVYQQNGQAAVQLNNDLSQVLGKTSSLLFWIKTTETGNFPDSQHFKDPAVTGVDEIGGQNDIAWGYLNNQGQIGIYVGDNGVLSTNPINDGQWHHVALTRDCSSGVVKVYVDGILNSSATLETKVKTTPFSLIGAMSLVGFDGNHYTTFQGATFFNGQLDDVQIYNSAVSADFIAAVALPPQPPSNLNVVAAPYTGGTELDLSWTNNATNATGVEVWSSVNNGAFTMIAQLSAGTTTYANTNLTPGTLYSYFIRATNAAWPANTGSDSATVNSATSITPGTPTGLTDTLLTANEVDLQWTAVDNNATSFKVLRRISPSVFTVIATLSANSTTYQDTAVFSGTTYTYEVIASNIAGDSNPATLTVTTAGPPTVTFESYMNSYNITDPSQNTLRANPAGDGVPNLIKYAFNMDPTVNDAVDLNPQATPPTGLPLISIQNGSLAITFVQRVPPTDITYTVQVSGDLKTWNSGPNYTTQVSSVAIDANSNLVTVEDNVVLSSAPNQRRFIRVQISK